MPDVAVVDIVAAASVVVVTDIENVVLVVAVEVHVFASRMSPYRYFNV